MAIWRTHTLRYNEYMSTPLSIRFESSVLDRLRRQARTIPGATASGLAQRLIDEGLRISEFPGIEFRDGPAGRRAALIGGPDIWEIVSFVRGVDERGGAAVSAAADQMALPKARVQLALDYYATFSGEIDEWISDSEAASAAAEGAWHTQQRLLA